MDFDRELTSMDAQLEVTNLFNMTCFFRSNGHRKGGITVLRDDNVALNACSLRLAAWGLSWRAYGKGVFSSDDARVGGNGEVKLFTHVQGQQHTHILRTYHLSIHLHS